MNEVEGRSLLALLDSVASSPRALVVHASQALGQNRDRVRDVHDRSFDRIQLLHLNLQRATADVVAEKKTQ